MAHLYFNSSQEVNFDSMSAAAASAPPALQSGEKRPASSSAAPAPKRPTPPLSREVSPSLMYNDRAVDTPYDAVMATYMCVTCWGTSCSAEDTLVKLVCGHYVHSACFEKRGQRPTYQCCGSSPAAATMSPVVLADIKQVVCARHCETCGQIAYHRKINCPNTVISCVYAEKGCLWHGPRRLYSTHINGCDYHKFFSALSADAYRDMPRLSGVTVQDLLAMRPQFDIIHKSRVGEPPIKSAASNVATARSRAFSVGRQSAAAAAAGPDPEIILSVLSSSAAALPAQSK